MFKEKGTTVGTGSFWITSDHLEREVKLNCYLPPKWNLSDPADLLLINDGQDLLTMHFENILGAMYEHEQIKPLLCVGIHCGEDRKNEYGMMHSVDYKGRGARAPQYAQFIFTELLPFIYKQYSGYTFGKRGFAGFSLGGLSALDIVWNHPETFSEVAVFSGSLWWRSKDQADRDYSESNDRLMHRQLNFGKYRPGLSFFFQCGELDETEDRNHNGVIDSIDDTIDIMKILQRKGYLEGRDMKYAQFPDGKHDVATWARAFPLFLQWAYSK